MLQVALGCACSLDSSDLPHYWCSHCSAQLSLRDTSTGAAPLSLADPTAAMGSNVTFQSRNVLSKKFMTKGG